MNDDCIARNTKSNFVYSMCSLDVNNYCTTLFVISILFVCLKYLKQLAVEGLSRLSRYNKNIKCCTFGTGEGYNWFNFIIKYMGVTSALFEFLNYFKESEWGERSSLLQSKLKRQIVLISLLKTILKLYFL